MSDADADLELLRGFRATASTPPPGLHARLEETLMQQVLAEEANRRRTGVGRWRWQLPAFARYGTVAAATATVVFAVSITGSPTTGSQARTTLELPAGATTAAGVSSAADSLLDTAASRVLGTAGGDDSDAGSIAGVTDIPSAEATRQPNPRLDLTPEQLERYPVVPGYAGEPSLLASGPASMTPEQLAEVPTDPRALLLTLRDATAEQYAAGGHDVDYATFRLAAYFLADPEVPVAVRAGFLRMLTLVDGVGGGGVSYDVFGRPGVVVGRVDRASGIVQRTVLDPASGRVFELRELATRAAPDRSECPPGTVVAIAAYGDDGFEVMPDAAPYANWPEVIPACA